MKSRKIISESLVDSDKNERKSVAEEDKNTILDEKNIKDIE